MLFRLVHSESVVGARNVTIRPGSGIYEVAATPPDHARPIAGAVNTASTRSGPLATDSKARKTSVVRTFCYGVLCFFAGVVFWHLVGFWSFVTDVVLAGPTSSQSAQYIPIQNSVTIADGSKSGPAVGGSIETGSVKQSEPVQPDADTKTAQSVPQPSVSQDTLAQQDIKNCSTLQLDRDTGEIVSAPCSPTAPLPQNGNGLGRQDLVLLKTAIQAPRPPAPQQPAETVTADSLRQFASDTQLLKIDDNPN